MPNVQKNRPAFQQFGARTNPDSAYADVLCEMNFRNVAAAPFDQVNDRGHILPARVMRSVLGRSDDAKMVKVSQALDFANAFQEVMKPRAFVVEHQRDAPE